MTQNAVSRLENPFYGKATITTLKRIAAVFDVALVVRFVPFSRLVKWVTGTTFEDHGLSSESTIVQDFAREDEANLTQATFSDSQRVPVTLRRHGTRIGLVNGGSIIATPVGHLNLPLVPSPEPQLIAIPPKEQTIPASHSNLPYQTKIAAGGQNSWNSKT
jgi:hypothetical protein